MDLHHLPLKSHLLSYSVLAVDIYDSYTYYQVSLDHAMSDMVTTPFWTYHLVASSSSPTIVTVEGKTGLSIAGVITGFISSLPSLSPSSSSSPSSPSSSSSSSSQSTSSSSHSQASATEGRYRLLDLRHDIAIFCYDHAHCILYIPLGNIVTSELSWLTYNENVSTIFTIIIRLWMKKIG